MRSFFAILKDSVKEAIDQKLIIVLLAMSALIILLTLSLSFEAAPADKAIPTIVQRFGVIFPEKGKSKVPVFTQGVDYKVKDVKTSGANQFEFILAIGNSSDIASVLSAIIGGKPKKDNEKEAPKATNTDAFRLAVINWIKPAGKTRTFAMGRGGPPMEAAQMQEATPDELKALSDAELEAFIAHQFEIQGGLQNLKITRETTGVKEPSYVYKISGESTGGGVRGWPHSTRLFFGAVTVLSESPLGLVLWILEDQVINGFGAFIVLLVGIIITAFFIPNMLRKGALDLLITKPVSRVALLIYKYIGGLAFVFILTAFTVLGMWVAIGIRSGFWNPAFLALIPILTFTFAILYAFSTLVGVVTRSALVSILLTCGFAFFLYIVGTIKVGIDDAKADPAKEVPSWAITTVDIIHGGLPRYKDLDRLSTKLISDSTLTPVEKFALAKSKAEYPDWAPTIGVSLAFIGVCLSLASWRFATRDG